MRNNWQPTHPFQRNQMSSPAPRQPFAPRPAAHFSNRYSGFRRPASYPAFTNNPTPFQRYPNYGSYRPQARWQTPRQGAPFRHSNHSNPFRQQPPLQPNKPQNSKWTNERKGKFGLHKISQADDFNKDTEMAAIDLEVSEEQQS